MREFKGTREAFSAALMDLAEQNDKVVLVSPDSLKAVRGVPFGETYPSRYLECGIAEQGAVDFAVGLASCGMMPFVGTYCGFLTMRACEQMRTFVGYTDLNVKFFGMNAGLIGGEREGVTHQFYEDLAVVSSIPNFSIFTPADAAQCYHAVMAAAETAGPVYIRGGSGREPAVFDVEAPFSPSGVTVMREYGLNTVLFSSGFVLDRVIAAAELLHSQGVGCTVADVNILYGANCQELIRLIKASQQIFTVEDHNVNGGLGSYISRLACEYAPRPVRRIALTGFGESGAAGKLADKYGFSPEAIRDKVLSALE